MAKAGGEEREKEQVDREDQALEEGDPKETGRMQGRLMDEREGEDTKDKEKPGERTGNDEDEHWESGRRDAR